MSVQFLSQLQFAVTTVYHFFFVPLTLGLSVLVAIMETIYVTSGNEVYKQMAKFWGKLFLINFAMGVVTGIVQEFQFGMNWSEYSRFVGDIFGAPLAIEALLAFFLESTFLGVWVFGWDRLSKKMHAATIWLVAIGSNLSALWILIANSFMQNPVGFEIINGRAVMTDFGALISNYYVWAQFPHTVTGGFTTGAMFVLGISAYHLVYKRQEEFRDFFKRSFNIAAVFGAISILLVGLIGHNQTQRMVQTQPMKIAAAEALWESEDPASFSLFTIGDEKNLTDRFAIRIPALISILAYNKPSGEVKGIRNLQAEYEALYGPGDYIPSVFTAYWSFRGMVGAAMLMLLIFALAMWWVIKDKDIAKVRLGKIQLGRWLPFAIALPYLANTTGWLLTEIGRQPWVVFGVMKTEDAYSPTVTAGMVLTSLIGFTLLYAVLMAADVYLLSKFAKAGPVKTEAADDAQAELAY